MLPDDISFVTDEAGLRALHLAPMSRASDKVLSRLDQHCRDILALSPTRRRAYLEIAAG